jgi:hypothetical protein
MFNMQKFMGITQEFCKIWEIISQLRMVTEKILEITNQIFRVGHIEYSTTLVNF